MNTLQSMFAHLHWADRRILTALQNLNGDCGEARRYFSHILLAEQIWFTRLQEKDSSHLTVWSELDVTALSRLIEQNHERIAAY